MKTLTALALTALLSGCAVFGNTGPVQIECKRGEDSFTLTLPLGSGREYPDGIKTGENHVCGEIEIPQVKQGEDRSQGLLGLLAQFIGL